MDDQANKPRVNVARDKAKKLLVDVGIIKPPVFMVAIVDQLKKNYDLSIYPWNFSNNIDGIQTMEGRVVAIGYNQEQHPHRQRFTIAHEIGHLLLGHTQKGGLGFDLESKKPEEIEANKFAAELLMPMEMLKFDVEKNNLNVKEIATKYNVSEIAVWWRLSESGLINKMSKSDN